MLDATVIIRRDTACVTGKVRYPRRQDAERDRFRQRQRVARYGRDRTGKAPFRVLKMYKCQHCRGWHLTSRGVDKGETT
jgi:hypothetical protein